MEPIDIPATVPAYMPGAPQLKTNANSPAKTSSSKNALNIVRDRDIVPFPMDWKRLPDMIPNGTSSKKNARICNASTIFGAKRELSAEYEKINDSGSAKMNKHEQIITDEIKPNFTP